jgi:hypothetical protein
VLKKEITYKDFNDEEVTETFYFNLSKAELVEMEMSHEGGGLAESLQRMIASEDKKAIITEFKGIILGAYGKRSDDGRRFMKSQEFRDEFESSEAYSELFMELITDTGAAIEFVNGIIPKNLGEEVEKLTQPSDKVVVLETPRPEEPTKEVQTVTKAELNAMSGEELIEITHRVASGEVKLVE